MVKRLSKSTVRSIKRKCWKCGQPVDHQKFSSWMLKKAGASYEQIRRYYRRRRPIRIRSTRKALIRTGYKTVKEVTLEYYEVLRPAGLPERPLAPVGHLVFKGKHWVSCTGSWRPAR
jgi:hypothetical protein